MLKRLSIYDLWRCRCSVNADEYTQHTHAYTYYTIKTLKKWIRSVLTMCRWITHAFMVNACCNFFCVFVLYCNHTYSSSFSVIVVVGICFTLHIFIVGSIWECTLLLHKEFVVLEIVIKMTLEKPSWMSQLNV